MSGFEVIGVVLGVWPIVVNGLAVYRATKDGKGYGLLLNELKTEELCYREFVRHLLQADLNEADLAQLTDRTRSNVGLLQDKSLQFSLKRRLGGEEKSELVLWTLKEMDKLLRSLGEKLGGLEDKGKIRASIRQMKHNLPTSTFRQELEQLKEHNHRLQRLITNCTASGFPAQGKQPSSPPMLSPNVVKENAAHAEDIYHVICNSYRCDCSVPHEANLGLRPLSSKQLDNGEPFELIFPIDEEKEDIPDIDLKSPTGTYSSTAYTETAVTDESYDTFSINRCWSPRNSVGNISPLPYRDQKGRISPHRRGRSVSVSKSDTDSIDMRRIDDLCIFVKSLDDQSSVPTQNSCLGILGMKEKEYTVKMTSVGVDAKADHRSVICLDDYLVPFEKWELTHYKRMSLALSLSKAILQFYSTPWIDEWWTWKDFCMLKDDNKQVFVTGKFYSAQKPSKASAQKLSQHPAAASVFWQCFGEPILTRLGFALIELALGQRLSELRDQTANLHIDPHADQDMLDTFTAKRLLNEGIILQEAGQLYHDAVQACVSHQVTIESGLRPLNSTHPDFHQDLERFVVGPIRDFHVATWGQIFELQVY